MLLTTGLQKEKAGRAGLAMYLSVSLPIAMLAGIELMPVQVIFALILEFIVFHTIPPFLSFLGTSIILASAYLVAVSKDPTCRSAVLTMYSSRRDPPSSQRLAFPTQNHSPSLAPHHRSPPPIQTARHFENHHTATTRQQYQTFRNLASKEGSGQTVVISR